MTKPNQLIVAIDTPNIENALDIAKRLKSYGVMFKLGMQFLYSLIAKIVLSTDIIIVAQIREFFQMIGGNYFLDPKLHDVDFTIGKAMAVLKQLLPYFVNVDATIGIGVIEEAVKNAGESLVLGVTILTHLTKEECIRIYGRPPEIMVPFFADTIVGGGANGIICSPLELSYLEDYNNLIKVTPGVRPIWAPPKGQVRFTTPQKAFELGANFIVVGSPITDPPKEIGSIENATELVLEEIIKV